MQVFCTCEMTHSPDMAGKAFVRVRLYINSGPQLLSEKMQDLSKHMKGLCEERGVSYLRNINKPISANKKTCKK